MKRPSLFTKPDVHANPWKNEHGHISAKTAVRWWITVCLMMGVSASTTCETATMLAKDLESKGCP